MAAGKLLGLGDLPDGERGLAQRLEECRARIVAAAERGSHDPARVRVVVVTKYVDEDVIRALGALGVRDFGENRVQQLEARASVFQALPDARVHFIGHLQRNKAKRILGLVDVFHALDSTRLLEELERRAPSSDKLPAEIYVEVNIPEETEKTGLAQAELPELLAACRAKPTIGPRVRGLMGMAALTDDTKRVRASFRRLRELRDRAVDEGLLAAGAELSMGMSDDFEIAVEEGATVVRVGSFFFS